MSKKLKDTLKSTAANGTDGGGPPPPIPGIDKHNFVEIGKTFIRNQGNSGFLIVRDAAAWVPKMASGERWPPTPREWGAWMAWRKSKYLTSTFIESKGYATVPARWPHLFDADWPEHKSVDAANRWQVKIEKVKPDHLPEEFQ